ncbi:odorant receptor 43a-like [Agrilus planipennis]|uniref:Odorant receptor 43a-like n=1 Tax=Agrilus planipennis TaxID=224129 RepID=A0A1W4X0L3_AGRPL|nr:odorant receptor 43a-like [Agrilus planipennis]
MAIEHELATHFTLLQGAFRTVAFKKPTEQLTDAIVLVKNRKKMQPEEYKLLSHLIHYTKHLQTTIQLTTEAEALFTFINLGAVLTSLLIIVSNFFTLSQAPLRSSRFFRQIIYMGAMVYQLGIYTSYGNEITLKSGDVLQGIYFSDWVPRSLEFKKTMLMNMARLKKPIYFTIGKFSPLTLATFVSILRAAYSFFAVLKSSTN